MQVQAFPWEIDLAPGETVEFTMGGSERLHAENVRLVRRSSPLSELMGQICSGTVRKFSGEWGFITSPHFDGDIFVGLRSNRHLAGPLVTGDIVEFRITRDVSKEKDTFEASNVRILSPATPTALPMSLQKAVPTSTRSRSPRKAMEMAPLAGKRSFRGDWGFVTSESFAGDLFVGTRSNRHLSTSLKEGDMISFIVEVENDLDRILRHSRGKSCSYVCQKYIENPLLIGGARKHDIRQWVMVTSLNPLTIYFFSECYVRIAAEDYSLDDFGDRTLVAVTVRTGDTSLNFVAGHRR
eukprot:s78_g8.t1